jgi:hypothetical protein
LTAHNAGVKIGTTFIGAPTVADGIALIAFTPTDLQCALDNVVPIFAPALCAVNVFSS